MNIERLFLVNIMPWSRRWQQKVGHRKLKESVNKKGLQHLNKNLYKHIEAKKYKTSK